MMAIATMKFTVGSPASGAEPRTYPADSTTIRDSQ